VNTPLIDASYEVRPKFQSTLCLLDVICLLMLGSRIAQSPSLSRSLQSELCQQVFIRASVQKLPQLSSGRVTWWQFGFTVTVNEFFDSIGPCGAVGNGDWEARGFTTHNIVLLVGPD